jgi:lysophospholipase L1-like esterase
VSQLIRNPVGSIRRNDLVLQKGVFPATATTAMFFGDSITVGVGASVPAKCWRNLLAARFGWDQYNGAISGGSIMDWIANAYSQATGLDTLSFILPGFNDQRNAGGDAAKVQAYKLALYAAVAHLAIPDAAKIKANSAAVTYAGTWAASPVRAYGKYTAEKNASATVKVCGDVVYISTLQQLGNGGMLNVNVDGVDRGTYTLRTSVANGGAVTSVQYMPMLIRIPGLGEGLHTVVLTKTDDTNANNSQNVWLDWIAGSQGATLGTPAVYLANTLRMNAAGVPHDAPNYSNYTEGGNAGFCLAADEVAGVLAADGLRVFSVNTSGVYDPATGDVSADNVHPSDQGMAKIADAFAAAMVVAPKRDMSGAVRKLRRDLDVFTGAVGAVGAGVYKPEIVGLTTKGSNTYTGQVGNYRVSAGMCTVWFDVQINAKGDAMAGDVCVTLPFPVSPTGAAPGVIGERSGYSLSANCTGLYLEAVPGMALAVIRQSAVVYSTLPPANIAGGARLRGTISFPV